MVLSSQIREQRKQNQQNNFTSSASCACFSLERVCLLMYLEYGIYLFVLISLMLTRAGMQVRRRCVVKWVRNATHRRYIMEILFHHTFPLLSHFQPLWNTDLRLGTLTNHWSSKKWTKSSVKQKTWL